MPSSHKGSIPQNALKLKKSCQKKFLKLFHVGNCFTPIGNCFTPIGNCFTPIGNCFTPIGNCFTLSGLAVKTNVFLYKKFQDVS